jgi:hypothetical protein
MLLSSVYALEERCEENRCIMHPTGRCTNIMTAATTYAADMNILFAYYQCLDDWNDDRNPVAKQKSLRLKRFIPNIREKRPYAYAAVSSGLQLLGQMERSNEMNPDLPANCFGDLLGAIFVWKTDEHAETLRRMGASLGRFIYLMDAVNDLHTDIRKQRYNPLVAQAGMDFSQLLTMIMAECTSEFDKLPVTRDKQILQNHLYAGVWQKYRARKQEGNNA